MDRGEEVKPATVSRCLGTKQAGEVAGRWAWTEPVVWTLRMLTALEEGVKGGKNAFFVERGLFSFVAAHVTACQSQTG